MCISVTRHRHHRRIGQPESLQTDLATLSASSPCSFLRRCDFAVPTRQLAGSFGDRRSTLRCRRRVSFRLERQIQPCLRRN